MGLIEVYDLAQSSAASLANISTRCQVLTGDQVLIGGFILKGGLPSKIIVRAIGPSLAKAGVRGPLADPMLELHDSNGMSITNDNWRATQESEIIATTIPPTDNREAAIVATLPPGPYTAIVRGANNTIGVALVEAYNLK